MLKRKNKNLGYKILESSTEAESRKKSSSLHKRQACTCPQCGYFDSSRYEYPLGPFGAVIPLEATAVAIMRCKNCGCKYEYKAPMNEVYL